MTMFADGFLFGLGLVTSIVALSTVFGLLAWAVAASIEWAEEREGGVTQPATIAGIIGLLVAIALIAALVGCSGPNRLSPEREMSPAQEQCRAAGKEDC